MRKIIFLLIGFVCLTSSYNNEEDQGEYKSGEYLKFKVYYSLFPFTAGHGTLNVSDVNFNGVSHHFVEGKGKTVGIYRIFPVDDLYATYINKANQLPTKFVRNINEGGYKKDLIQYFDHSKNEVKVVDNKNKTTQNYKSKANIQDMLSAFYYLRTLNFDDKKEGDFVGIDVFMDEEIYPFKMKVLGREERKTKFGKVNCLKLRPYVQSGRVFKAQESVTFWVTDDSNHVPVEIKAELSIGSLKAELIEHKNTVTPINFK